MLWLSSNYVCQRANHWTSLLKEYCGYLENTFANDRVIGRHGFRGYCSYLETTFAKEQIVGLHRLRDKGDCGYLEATFAKERVIGLHCLSGYGAILKLRLPKSRSLDFIA